MITNLKIQKSIFLPNFAYLLNWVLGKNKPNSWINVLIYICLILAIFLTIGLERCNRMEPNLSTAFISCWSSLVWKLGKIRYVRVNQGASNLDSLVLKMRKINLERNNWLGLNFTTNFMSYITAVFVIENEQNRCINKPVIIDQVEYNFFTYF